MTQRTNDELLGATMIRERLLSDFNVQISPQDVNLVMKKFDTDGAGVSIRKSSSL